MYPSETLYPLYLAKVKNKMTTKTKQKKVSRQREWQLRKAKEGLCIVCGKPQTQGKFCSEHTLMHRVRQRELMRKKLGCNRRNLGAASYQDGEKVFDKFRNAKKN